MGSEINEKDFSREDFQVFAERLRIETELLKTWWRSGQLSEEPPRVGLELEAWLVDGDGRPAPLNDALLARLADPMVGPELAQFNIEFNTAPQALRDHGLSALERELAARWARSEAAARELGCRLGMIGTLPTAREADFNLEHMSHLNRYGALNEQILTLRNRQPIKLDIQGEEPLRAEHCDVMLEAAATSFQVHLQATPRTAPALFNASVMVSAATVALAANSPYLFGQRLWEETRIPLFEQAVAVSPLNGGDRGPFGRVSFGGAYGRDALFGFFIENRQHYPVLLPVLFDDPPEKLSHLRLHNGTIWRWNRPLVGFDADGRCHLRIEHRVMAAGPTIVDCMANAAFYYGVVHALAESKQGADARLPFPLAERNFYAAARHGLRAEVDWFGGQKVALATLIERELLPLAAQGLSALGVDSGEISRYLGIVEERVRSGRTGSAWQQAYVGRHGRDFAGLMRAYLENQESGSPVHRWPL